MSALPGGWRRWLRIWQRAPGMEIDAELRFHFDERIAELVAQGATPETAQAQAHREFGDVGTVRRGLVTIDTRITHARSRAERWEWLGQDLRYVRRSVRRSPGFVVTVALTLGLGLGVNAAIFSLLDRLFVSAPPGIAHAEQVRRIARVDTNAVVAGQAARVPFVTRPNFSYPELQLLRTALPAAIPLGGYYHFRGTIGAIDDVAEVNIGYVVGDYFSVLGVHPKRGRVFSPEELKVETPVPLVVIGDALWRNRFGSRTDIVGADVVIAGQHCTVIGVLPPGFHGADNDAADAWMPMNTDGWGSWPWYNNAYYFRIAVLIRTTGPAQDALVQQIATGVFRHDPGHVDSLAKSRVEPLTTASLGRFDKEVAIATRLAGVALIILLIAMANVVNLLLMRGMHRRREIAVRLALGTSRQRLVGLLLMESLAVSLIGGAVALAMALWTGTILRRMLLPEIQWVDSPINLHVFLFTLLLVCATGALVGLLPALRSSRPDVAASLRGGVRDGGMPSRLRGVILVAQVTLSVVLLVGAGLFVRSLRSVQTEPTGYDQKRIVFATLQVDPKHQERARELANQLPAVADQLRAIPGVDGMALDAWTPLENSSKTRFYLPGRDTTNLDSANGPFASSVSPAFFDVMGMHILRGRGLLESDRDSVPHAVVINATMGRRFWPGVDPIGRCVILGNSANPCTPIVGIVSDAHVNGIIEEPSLQFYLPLSPATGPHSAGWRARVIVLHTAAGQAGRVVALASRQLRQQFAGWAEPDVHPMTKHLDSELHPWRTGASLFSAAGLLALLVAIVGIYSTISYTFSQRTREIGVRMALGAGTRNVVALVVGEGLRVVLIGVVLGTGLALAGGRVVAALLYHTSPRDPAVLLAASLSLLIVAAVACLIPAWRAMHVDPASTLRIE